MYFGTGLYIFSGAECPTREVGPFLVMGAVSLGHCEYSFQRDTGKQQSSAFLTGGRPAKKIYL